MSIFESDVNDGSPGRIGASVLSLVRPRTLATNVGFGISISPHTTAVVFILGEYASSINLSIQIPIPFSGTVQIGDYGRASYFRNNVSFTSSRDSYIHDLISL